MSIADIESVLIYDFCDSCALLRLDIFPYLLRRYELFQLLFEEKSETNDSSERWSSVGNFE